MLPFPSFLPHLVLRTVRGVSAIQLTFAAVNYLILRE
jgi:hypothetical protein